MVHHDSGGGPATVPQELEESHDAIWAAMQTVVVRDCAQQLLPSGGPLLEETSDSESGGTSEGAASNTRRDPHDHEASKARGPSSSTSSTSSTLSDDEEKLPFRQWQAGGCGGLLAERQGGGEECNAVMFSDLFGSDVTRGATDNQVPAPSSSGMDGDDEAAFESFQLPSVEEARSHLDDILARRREMQAIAARYDTALCQHIKATASAQRQGAPAATVKLAAAPQDSVAFDSPAEAVKSSGGMGAGGGRGSSTESSRVPILGPRAPPPDAADVSDVLRRLGSGLTRLAASRSSGQDGDSAAGPATFASEDGSRHAGAGELAPLSHPQDGKQLEPKPESGAGPSPAWPVDSRKLQVGREKEATCADALWQSFLAGDDQPVGCDALPSPQQYYTGRPS